MPEPVLLDLAIDLEPDHADGWLDDPPSGTPLPDWFWDTCSRLVLEDPG